MNDSDRTRTWNETIMMEKKTKRNDTQLSRPGFF